jgi:SAM-dependent methyltransferase
MMPATQRPRPDQHTLAWLRNSFLEPSKASPVYLERASLVRALRELADLLERGLILDLGCGMKPYEPLLRQPGDRWVGVDHPPSMEGSYGAFTLADAFADCHELPFGDGVFDSVVCTQVLEHVTAPAHVLGEIARVLRPGGVLLLTAPMLWALHEEPYDYYRYTQYGLRHLLGKADLTVLREVQRGHAATALGQTLLDLLFAGGQTSRLCRGCQHLLCRVVNSTCAWLDRVVPTRRLALGWAVAARKEPSGASRRG